MIRLLSVIILISMIFGSFCGHAEDTSDWTIQDVRGAFEQYILPEWFYEDPTATMNILDRYGLFSLWDYYTQIIVPFETTYSDDEFDVTEIQDADFYILRLTMPYPEWEEHCYRIYLCYEPEADIASFYTVEYNKMFWDYCLIYEREADGTYIEYSETKDIFYPEDPDYEDRLVDEAEYIKGLFMSKIRWVESDS